MLPNRASDSGPLCHRPHPMDPTEYVTCAACLQSTPKTSASRCQGAVPDRCCSYICEDCQVKCWGCNLPVCEEHRVVVDHHVTCHCCREEIVNERMAELAAAVNALAEVA